MRRKDQRLCMADHVVFILHPCLLPPQCISPPTMHLSPHVVVRSTLTVVRGLDAFQTENVGRSTCNADVNVLALSSPLARSPIPNPGSLHHIPRTGESQWHLKFHLFLMTTPPSNPTSTRRP